MTPAKLAQMVTSWRRVITAITNRIERKRVKVYRSTGEDKVQIKEWYGKMTTTNGNWSFNISSAGFTEILHVEPYVVYNSTDFARQVLVSIGIETLTFVSGRLVTGHTKKGDNAALMVHDVAVVGIRVTGH